MRTCRICLQEKSLEEFPKNKNCKSGYEGVCKACAYAKQVLWKQQNQQQYKAAKNNWYLKNKQTVFEKAAAYAKANPEWKADHCAKRRRRNRDATPKWDMEFTEFAAQEARSLCKLRYKATNIKWHVDHIIPLHGKTVCGLHVWNNLAVVPAIYNIKKGNRYNETIG